MSFVSTRGKAPSISFLDLILSGTAPDGGLYVPYQSIKLPRSFLEDLRGTSYAETAVDIFSFFADGFSRQELQRIIGSTYTADIFRHARPGDDPNDIVPVRQLWGSTYLAGLSNGPSLAFKDIALQLLAAFVAEALPRKGMDFYTILLGTSGDTGPAAIEAFRRFEKEVNLFVMSGGAGMSAFQRAQMDRSGAANVYGLRLQNFDRTQDLLKEVFADRKFVDEVHLGAVNSVNLVRILAQSAYTFWGYLKVADEIGEAVDFFVPSGNLGNACSVLVAKELGVPVGKIWVVTNENDVLWRFFTTGVYDVTGEVKPTTSPSMDIVKASNLERILHYVLKDAKRIRDLYAELKKSGCFKLTEEELALVHEAGFEPATCSMDEGRLMIQYAYKKTGLFIDSHTATAVQAMSVNHRPGVKSIAFETAREYKFLDLVWKATRVCPELPQEFAAMMDRPPLVSELADITTEQLKRYIRHRLAA